MLIKILGLIDVVGGLILIFGAKYIPSKVLFFLGVVFLLKSIIGMWKDFGSWVDVSVGIILILSAIITVPSWIGLIVGLLGLQKGAFSFMG